MANGMFGSEGRGLRVAVSLVFALAATPLAFANPTGGTVDDGEAEISSIGNTLTITQTSQRAIISWQDFSIAAGEITRFVQPSSSAAVLNRVISDNPSQLFGTLEANGTVLLINQNGILVGEGAVINVNSFLASTLDLSDSSFMSGSSLQFMGTSRAAIRNLGSITAGGGNVYLIARQIDNQGDITATGEAGMLAGAEVLLSAEGNGASVRIADVGELEEGEAITNSGAVQAAMVTMDATGSMYSVAVNNSGVVRATGADTSGGRVRLTGGAGTVFHSGVIDASGETGGRVEITGDRVGLTGNAVVDASGTEGDGGEVYIGGGWQGGDADIDNASRTFVGSDVTISVDAGANGDGGTAVVWADEVTRFGGTITARGGSESGDGGNVEVSGAGHLQFVGLVDTSAANGSAGRLLLDPTDITINDDAADANISGATPFEPATATGSILTWSTILTNLGLGNVEVTTASGFDAVEAGHITITESPDFQANSGAYSSANTLTLTADLTGDIIVNAAVSNAGTGGLVLNVGNDLSINAALDFDTITVNSGNQTIGLGLAAGDVTVDNTELDLITADTLTFNSGFVSGVPAILVDGVTGAATLTIGTLVLNATDAAGDIIFGAGTASTINGNLVATVGDEISIQNAVTTTTGTVTLTSQSVVSPFAIGFNAVVTSAGEVILVADTMAISAGGISAAGQRVTLRPFTPGNDINLGGVDVAGDTLGLTDDELDLITADVLRIGDANSGAMTLSAAINPAGTDELILGSGASINSGVFAITVASLATRGAGLVTLDGAAHTVTTFASSTTGAVNLEVDGTLAIGSVGTINGVNLGANAFTVTTAGDLTQTLPLTVSNLTVDTTGNAITLTNTSNNVSGVVSLDGAATQFRNTVATSLGDVSATSLSVISTLAISQQVGTTVTATGATAFTTTTDDQAITLDNTGNLMSGELTFTTATAGGNAGHVTLRNGGTITFSGLATSIAGDLTVTQEGNGGAFNIAQNGAGSIAVAGLTTLTNLDTTSGAVTIGNNGDLVFGPGVSTIDGDLTVLTAGGGDLTQTGAIRVNGDFDATGVAGTSTIDNAGNIFDGAYTDSQGSIILIRVGDIDINFELGSGPINTGAGSLTVVALETGDEFDAAGDVDSAVSLSNTTNSFAGGVVITTGDAGFTNTIAGTANITQSDNLTVGGTATFSSVDDATNQNPFGIINLTTNTTTLSGVIQLRGDDVSLSNTGATNLGVTTTTTALSVVSTLAITDSGVITSGGTSSFETTTAANAITLDSVNMLTGAVTLTTNSSNATLNNNMATLLGNVGLDNVGHFVVTSNGTITQDAGTAISVANLDVTATAGSVELTSATNTVTTLVNGDAAVNFRLYDADGFSTTGAIDAVDDVELDVAAGGIGLGANVTAGGQVELDAAAGGVTQTAGVISATDLVLNGVGTFTLNQAGNNVDTLAATTTGTVNYTDANTLALNAISTTSGNLNVTVAAGNITVDGAVAPGAGNVTLQSTTGLIVQGTGALNMGSGNLNLNNGIGGAVGANGNAIQTSGNYSLNSAPSLAGGVFISNDTVGGDITVNTLNPSNGTISLVNLIGNIIIDTPVASDTLAVVTLDASHALQINDTVDGTTINLLAGTDFTVSADVGAASTTAINVTHGGNLTSAAGGTLVTTGVITITDTGGVAEIGNSVVDPLLTQATRINLVKTSTGDSFISNTGSLELHGSFNGFLDFRTTAGGNITIGNDALSRDLTNDGGATDIVLFSDGQLIGDGVVFANGANMGLRATNITGNLAGNYLELDGVGILEARATAGGVRISHTGGDFDIGLTASNFTASLNGGILATGAIDIQQAANATIDVLGNVNTGNNITVQIADSGPGTDQLLVASGVTVGSGSGGNISLGGGVNNQGTISANAGFTTFLDGGRPTLTLGGNQVFIGNVVFAVTGDIEITGQISQTSTSGSILLIADSDGDGVGGIIVTDQIDTHAFIRSAGTLTMEAAELGFTTLEGGAYTNAGVAIAIVSDSLTPIVGGNANSGSIFLEAFDDAGNNPLDIVINGAIRSTDATGVVQITSTGGIAMGDNIRGANDVIISNEGLLSRTAPGATIITGGAGELIFIGAGDIGTLTDRILTDVGVIDFDSSGADTKIGANAFIQETGGVSLIGTLNNLDLVANGTVAQTGVLDMALVTITTTSGNITLNTSANLVDAFGVISSSGTFDYLGNQALQLTDTVDANSSIAINLGTVGLRNLDQLLGATVTSGNNLDLTVNTATLRDDWNVLATFTLNNTGLVQRSGDSLITANNATLLGAGSVGSNLDTGLNTAVNSLDINKTDGSVFILEEDAIQIGGSSGTLGGVGTLNLSNLTGNITIGAIGINKSSGGNVHLYAENGQIIQSTTTPIRMGGGELLLRAIDGVGSSGAPIITSGSYTLSALNADGFGGIYIVNQTNVDTVVTIGAVQAFTPTSPALVATFNGLQNLSTNEFGGSDIILNNLRGNIVVDDVINPENAGQNVYLLAAGTAGANNFQIQQGATLDGGNQRGVINMQGGDLYLRATAGIGNDTTEASTLKTSGNFGLAARVTTANAGGIYLTSVDYGTSGDITITTMPSFSLGVFNLPSIDGVSTPVGSTGDIRIQNSGDGTGTTGNIIVGRSIVPGTGRDVVLISDNGAILNGGAAGVINMTGGDLLLSADQGIGTLADPVLTTGFYNFGFENGTAGNINVLNTVASAGFGNITVTAVSDVLGAGGLGTVSGGSNTADGVGQGAIRIRNNAVGASAGDIIAFGTSITTTGTTGDDAFIELIANDDLRLGDGTQTASTSITTANGAITMTASNANADGITGILVTASDTTGAANTVIAAGGAGGAVNMTATANAGTINILGGDAAGASTSVSSTADMTVITNEMTVAGSDAAVTGSFADLTSDAAQSITVVTGDLDVLGGAAGDGNYARIQGNQDIIVQAGNLNVIGGAGANAFAQIESTGSGAAAQDITVGEVMTVRGGAGQGSFAYVNTTEDDGDQVIEVQNISNAATALIIEGTTTAGNTANEAAIISLSETATAQTITVVQGNVTILGNDSVSAVPYGTLGETGGALILTFGGQTIDIEDGALTITGGDTDGAGAGIGAGGTGAQNITVALDLTMAGGAGSGAIAAIESESQQTIRVGYLGMAASGTPANLTLTGGDGVGAMARITGFGTTANAQSIFVADGNLSVIGNNNGTNPGGTAGIATFEATSGQYIEVNGVLANNRGNLTITGGATAGDDAGIASDGATQVIVVDNRISLTGGVTNNQTFILNETGTQTITAGTGMSLVGGGDGTWTFVASVDAQTITVNNDGVGTFGELTLLGGTGLGAVAFIGSEDTQTITVDGYLTINGGAGQSAVAGITATDVQMISVLGNTLTTFTGIADTALGLQGGSNGTDGGDAFITQTDSTGRQSINLTVGGMVVRGGTGVDADATIVAAGEDGAGAGEEAQRIVVQDGGMIVFGGQGDNSGAGILQTNVEEAQQYIEVAGNIELLGGSGDFANVEIISLGGDDPDFGGGQTLLLSATGNLAIVGGSGDSSYVAVEAYGATQDITVTDGWMFVQGNMNATEGGGFAHIETNRNDAVQTVTLTGWGLLIQGGLGDGEYAGIFQNGSDGQQLIDVDGDLYIFGNSGAGASAEIYANGQNNGAVAAQTVLVSGFLLIYGDLNGNLTAGGYAGIRSDSNDAASQIVDVERYIELIGGVGSGDEAGIWAAGVGSIDTPLAQNVNARQWISITGGSGTNAPAQITSYNVSGDQLVVVQNANGAPIGLGVYGTALAGNTGTEGGIISYSEGANSQVITVMDGDFVLAANAGVSNAAYGNAGHAGGAVVHADGQQTIDVQSGNFIITGGSVANSRAIVAMTDNTQNQTITVDGYMTVAGGSGQNADAYVSANGVQTVTVSGNALTTFGGIANTGLGLMGGTDATNGGDAYIEQIDATDQQTVTVTLGSMVVLGGVGENADAFVSAAGLNNGVVAQGIYIMDGDLVLDAGNATADNSNAYISQTNAGAASQIINVNGTVDILGGDGANETALVTSAGTGAQTLLIDAGLTIAGGDGFGSAAGIRATGVSVDQTVTVNTGHALLTGGAGENAHAFIEQTNAVGTQDININAGLAASNLAILGGTGINADAYIAAFGTLQTVTLVNGALTVRADQTNAATANADAYILASNAGASQDIDVTNGGIIVEGGLGSNETAYISLLGANGTGSQTINLNTTGDFSILGGEGANSSATVRSDGLVQSITLDNGMLTVQADQDNAATSGGNALVSNSLNTSGAAVQTINVTNGGILVQGGVGTDTAIIQQLDTDGQQSIHAITAGDLLVLGGAGNAASAGIFSHGLDNGTEAQRIVVDAGDLVVDAGDGTNGNSTAGISQFNVGAASQYIEVGGNISVLGGDGANESAVIHSRGAVGQSVILDATGNLVVIGGDGFSSFAEIENDGLFQTINIVDGDFLVQGNQDSTNSSATATIHAHNLNVVQMIVLQDGDMTVQGGAGTNEWATVGVFGTSGQQIIDIQNGDLSILGGTGSSSSADVVSFGLDGLTVTQRVTVNGDLFVIADLTNAATANGWAALRAANAGAGSQFIDVEGLIQVTGGVGTNDYATIYAAGNGNGGLAQDINALHTVTITAGPGQAAYALVRTLNAIGDQQLVVQNANADAVGLAVLGAAVGGNSANEAGLTSFSTTAQAQYIQVLDGSVVVDANSSVSGAFYGPGAALQAGAVIQSAGNQVIEVQGGSIASNFTITGGDVASSRALVSMNSGVQAQVITVANGNLTLDGGTAADTSAGITSSNTQDISVYGYATLLGGSGLRANAFISAVDLQTILVSGNNLTTVGGITNVGLGLLGGTNATDGGDAYIQQTNATARQDILVNTGSMVVLGGVGENADAFVAAAGVDAGADEAQSIVVAAGNLVVDAGDDTNNNTQAYIEQSNGGVASQYIAIAGSIDVLGGDGANEQAYINSAGQVAQTILLTATGDFNIIGGDGQSSGAFVGSDGVAQTILVSDGNLLVQANQDDVNGFSWAGIEAYNNDAVQDIQVPNGSVTVQGGAGVFENAGIYMYGNLGRQSIFVGDGDFSILGGTGEWALAEVGSNGIDSVFGAAQSIVVANGDLLVIADQLNDTTNFGWAAIFQNNNGAASQFIDVEGDIVLTGGVGNTEFATIEASGEGSGGLAQDINALNTMTITGGSGQSSSALIGSYNTIGDQQVVVQNAGAVAIGLGIYGTSVAGNTGNEAGILSASTTLAAQTIIVEDGSFVMDANSSVSPFNYGLFFTAGAVVQSEGSQSIDIQAGTQFSSFLVLGGDVAGSGAVVSQLASGAGQFQTINVANGDMTLEGGFGQSAVAYVGARGVTQDISVINGDLLVQANLDATNGDATAYIEQNNANGIQTIFVDGGDVTVAGGAGNNEYAGIFHAAANGEQYIEVTDGDLSVLGGTGQFAGAEVWSTGLYQEILVNGDLFVIADQFGAATDSGYAAIWQFNGGSASQFIDVEGDIVLTGGVGTDEYARIVTTGAGNGGLAQDINALNTMTITGGSGQGAYALIETTNVAGDQQVVVQNAGMAPAAIGLGIYGTATGGNTDNEAGITTLSTTANAQTIIVMDGSFVVAANSSVSINTYGLEGITAGAVVQSAGSQVIEVQAATMSSDFLILGGDVAGSAAIVAQMAAVRFQFIEVYSGFLVVEGGYGENGSAAIDAAGLFQTILVTDGDLLVLGNQDDTNGFGYAYIWADNADAVQVIVVDGGDVVIQGGAGFREYAGIYMTGNQGQQYIEITDGDLAVLAGTGEFGLAEIYASGLDDGAMVAQRILVNGSLFVIADQFDGTTQDGFAGIWLDNFGAASQFIHVQGDIQVLAGVGLNESAYIWTDGEGSGGGLAQDIYALNTVTITGGSGPNAFAWITSTNAIGDQQLVVENAGEIAVGLLVAGTSTGGNTGNDAGIISWSETATAQTIIVMDGSFVMDANNSVSLAIYGFDGITAGAVVQSAGGQVIEVQAATLSSDFNIYGGDEAGGAAIVAQLGDDDAQFINVANGSLLLAGGDGEFAPAFIEATGLTQDIFVTGGDLTVIASQDANNDNSPAYIVAWNDFAVQTVDVATGAITIQGGAGFDEFAAIGMLGLNGQQSINVGNGDLSVLAGTGELADAVIVSDGVDNGTPAQLITVNGNLFVISDQLNAATSDAIAAIEQTNQGAASQVISVLGDIVLMGGVGTGEFATISAAGDGNGGLAQDIYALNTVTVTGGSGQFSSALIASYNPIGDQQLVVENAGEVAIGLGIYGTSLAGNNGNEAGIVSYSETTTAQTIIVMDGSFVMDANSSVSTTLYGLENRTVGAVVQSAGGQVVEVQASTQPSDFNIFGGDVMGSAAVVTQFGDDDGQLVDVSNGNLLMIAGDGESAIVGIESNGLTQDVFVTNGDLTLSANQDAASGFAYAHIWALNIDSRQVIVVDGGDVLIQGGAGVAEWAGFYHYGTNGQQYVELTDGDLSVFAGTGDSSSAVIYGLGIDGVTLAQEVRVNGNVYLIADQSDDSTSWGYAHIALDNAGAASQLVDVEGVIVLTGGVGSNEFAEIYASGTGNGGIAQDINALHTMTITAGSGEGAYALITSDNVAGDQVIVVQNAGADAVGLGIYGTTSLAGNTANEAGIVSYSETATAQWILVLDGDLVLDANRSVSDAIYGSLGNFEAGALIRSSGDQDVIVAGDTLPSDLLILGGDVENARAMISQNGTVGGQTIFVMNGDMTLQAGPGEYASAHTASDGLTQTIQVAGALSLLADQDGTNGFGLAEIIAFNADAVQWIDVASGDMTLQGGAGADGVAQVVMAGANGQQLIVVNDGDLAIRAGAGDGAFARILSSGVDNGLDAQTIVVNGNLSVVADQTGDATTGGYAAILQSNGGAASQYIEVTGSVDVLGGVGAGEAATITSNGATAQTILLTGVGDLNIIGGDGEFSQATIIQSSGLMQDIIVSDGDILVQASQDANNDNSPAYIVAGGAGAVQTIVATNGGITVQGGPGIGEFAGIANFSGDGQQMIEAGNGDIMVLAGSGDDSFAEIISFGMDGANSAQTIAASGDIIVTADGEYARIYTSDSQLMFAGGDIVVTGGNALGAAATVVADNAQNITIVGGLQILGGSSVDADDHAMIYSGGQQDITVQTGGLLIQANAGGGTLNGFVAGAGIFTEGTGTQTVTVNGGGMSMIGGSAAGASAGIMQDAAENQTITVTGSVAISGGSAAGAFAAVYGEGDQLVAVFGDLGLNGGGISANDDDFAAIGSGGDQVITVTGNFLLNANGGNESVPFGSESAGAFASTVGDQTVTVGGNLTLNGGNTASALIESMGTLQTVSVGGNINLDDGTGGNALVISAGDQIVTSTGATNITANDGNVAGFRSVGDMTLTNGGGTWIGAFEIGSPTMVTINNSGAIVIDETSGAGMVTAPVLVLMGNGTIGSGATGPGGVNTRLNTNVDEIIFANGTKAVYISEFDGVALRGTIGTLDLITDNAGDITDSSAPLVATVVTLQTADGNIDFGNQTHAVTTFRGVIANNGMFTYTGGATTFANRAVSAEVLAGAGVYADTGISIDTGAGNVTFTTSLVAVGGTGDLYVTGASIVMNATGATTGGDASSPTDGRFTTVDGTQTYDGPVILLTNTQISASGAADDVNFLGTIDGPGGLTIGSTPYFGGFIGDTTPLAYLILNSANAYFLVPDANSQTGAFTAVIDGSFVNNGTMHLDGPAGTYTFVTDNGTVGPGTGNFTGGTMVLNGNIINIFGATDLQVTGSDLPLLQLFNAWNGSPFLVLVGFESGAVYLKGPPPQEELKDTHDRRADRGGLLQVSYDRSDRAATEYGGRAMAARLVQPIKASSYATLLPHQVGHFTFGRDNRAPAAGLEPKQLVQRNQ